MSIPIRRSVRAIRAPWLLASVMLFASSALATPDALEPFASSDPTTAATTRTTTAALPAFSAADPGAPAVSEADLMANERFWPYTVSLTSDWQVPAGERTLRAGTKGVLVRVEAGDRVRVDLGREGVVTVPVGHTDVVARANAIRAGESRKDAPNLTWAIGARILDGGADEVALYGMENALAKRGYLLVFVDPADTTTFDAMATVLGGFGERDGVLTVVVPQRRIGDGAMLAALGRADWSTAYLLAHLAMPYTASLLGEDARAPYVMLQTNEGRVVFEGPWSETLVPALSRALATSFGSDGAKIAAW